MIQGPVATCISLYCAPCHGYDGKGSGPVAGTLKTTPPDLTELATRNGGAFPADRIAAFLAKRADHSTMRIGHVVDYLATMQTEIMMVAGTLSYYSRTPICSTSAMCGCGSPPRRSSADGFRKVSTGRWRSS